MLLTSEDRQPGVAHPVNGGEGLSIQKIVLAEHIHSIQRGEHVLDSLCRQRFIHSFDRQVGNKFQFQHTTYNIHHTMQIIL